MTKTKQVVRVIILIILIILACAGIGLVAPLHNRPYQMDNEIRIELVQKKRDEEDESESEEKN